MASINRRELLAAGAGIAAGLAVRPAAAVATPGQMEAAIRAVAGDKPVTPGKVKLDIPPLVENGNSVSVTVTVDSPMNSEHYVRTIALFNEKNPQPNVANFQLGHRAGRASVSTRMRLATTQKVTAIAELNDGSFWSDSADVVVTLAACVEE